jgi:uncharacterized protein involved in exopolysaccharide biosynthesis
MNIRILIQLLRKNLIWFIIIPLVASLSAYYATRNEPKAYVSTATLFTGFASGYTVLSNEQRNYIDHTAVNNAFDNLFSTIRSKETLIGVSARLITRHLYVRDSDSQVLDSAGMRALKMYLKEDLRQKLLAPNNELVTLKLVDSMARASGTNSIKDLFYRSNTIYSLSRINRELKATRKNTSDMLEMEYQSNDPAVAQNSLQYVIDVFKQRYNSFKSSETESVVGFFETQTNAARQKLESAEQRIKSFDTRNRIVNFDEQAKNTAAMREVLYDQYNKELMSAQAAKAALDVLNQRVNDRSQVITTNDELSNKKNELSEVNSKLAVARAYNQSKDVIQELQTRSTKLSEELRTLARKYYSNGNSTESLPQSTVLEQWFTKSLEYEEATARLKVYEKQLKEYDAQLTKYTPLGTEIQKLRREKDLAEKEYSSTLQELSQSRLKQKDVQMQGGLSVIDSPDYPLQPLPSKRWMLIAASFATGLVLALMVLLVRFWTDDRINSPEQAEALTGLPIVAAFPMLKGASPAGKAYLMAESMTDWLRTAIDVELTSAYNKQGYTVIVVFGTRAKQEKSWVAEKIAHHYGRSGHRVAYFYPNTTLGIPLSDLITNVPYEVTSSFADSVNVKELAEGVKKFEAEKHSIVILELPNLVDCGIPTHLVEQSTLSILVMDAQSKWRQIDQQLYLLYRKAANHPILSVLNRVDLSLIDLPQTPSSNYHTKTTRDTRPENRLYRLESKTTENDWEG